jgi:coatomer protein complex subunit gamma
MDSDDEVRDRATYFLSILLSSEKPLVRCYIVEPLQLCLPTLEHTLVDYLAPQQQQSQPFDIASIPLAPIPQTLVSEDPVDPIATTPHSKNLFFYNTFTNSLFGLVRIL